MPSLPQLLHGTPWRPRWRALLIALLLIVTAAALAPGTAAPTFGIGDKLGHVLAFVSLAVAASLAGAPTRRHAAACGIGLLAYGAFIEIAQTQVPGRHGDLVDLAIDAVGVTVGIAVAHGLRRHWPAPKH